MFCMPQLCSIEIRPRLTQHLVLVLSISPWSTAREHGNADKHALHSSSNLELGDMKRFLTADLSMSNMDLSDKS